jgi:glutamine cyclotransferase
LTLRLQAPRFAILLCALTFSGCQAEAQPKIETAQIVATFPHDTSAFTEGLLIHDGVLIESTGLEGQSDIRKTDLKTGRVLARTTLDPRIFGEGIVAWKDELISVTWKGGTGFRWALKSLKQKGSFRYTGEGWGMTHDGKALILSDGTPVLRFLDPRSLKVTKTLPVTLNGDPIDQLNELEYVRGEILANIWMTNLIARIDPASGAVKGLIDIGALADQTGSRDPNAVANGIAYDAKADRLFVTGKNWPILFEIKRPQ